ncbi:minor tail protein [Arthrobacter phage Odyssey395]|nr:minor tail protein [Arthrobacter phage Odyssey395]
MASLPEGISTALVHMDAPVSFIGEPGRLHVEVVSSASLIWAPTGTPVTNFEESLDLDDGQELQIQLPHVDQAGFEDGNGNAYTGWYYTVTVTYEKDGQIRSFPTRDFQVLVGQDEVDLALVPSGESYVPEVAPILPVTSLNGRTGAVTLTKSDVGLASVDNTTDVNKPISSATQAALSLKAPINNPAFTGNVTGVTKGMVGLGNVDNTPDNAKPVSTPQQAALDTKANATHTHAVGDTTGLQGALDAKAPKDSPTFTGTVTGVSKGHVGLGNVDNTSDAAKPVSTAQANALNLKADKNNPTFTGTVTLPSTTNGLSKSNVGLGNVDNTADSAKPVSTLQQTALNAKADKAEIDGILVGDSGKKYRVVAFTLRHNGTTFEALDDAGHTPIGISSVTVGADSITVNFSFTAATVGAASCVPDETLSRLGYQFGASVGLSSMVIYASQPGGFADYLSYNGSAWTSLNGFITSVSAPAGDGAFTVTHPAMAPIGGMVSSRSNTYRATTEGMGSTTTNFKLVNSSGTALTSPNSTDCKVWLYRAGARAVPPSELVQANSNIWVQGIFEIP